LITVLDLFCGAGGASKGYHDAGFQVSGVDIHLQPYYPYHFSQMNALQYLRHLIDSDNVLNFDLIHASPPCQAYSRMSKCNPHLLHTYPDLIPPVRELLIESGLPYIIENVEGSELIDPIKLCATAFDRRYMWPGKGIVELRRHRNFESNLPLRGTDCDHCFPTISVTGHGGGSSAKKSFAVGKGYAKASRHVMGIDWCDRRGLTEAIPPVYTKFLGKQVMDLLKED
jgi:DNA (cytosine-5)-methyltransferase 1